MKQVETVIIGGGQAGLATSYYLSRKGHEHILLEQSGKAVSAWRKCWDSFTLVTPNSAFRMPGIKHKGVNRDGFMPRDAVIEFFEEYIKSFKLPVKYKTQAVSVTAAGRLGYHIQTNADTYHSKNVVVATGFFQQPKIPGFATNISAGIHQLHSSSYRNPASIPDGAVLIVGSGQAGCQIAEELYLSGRKVFLSVGTAGRAPRRYRGKDIIEWLELVGFFDLTPDQLPPGMGKFDGIPHVSGTKGGHTLNLHQFARDGVTLLGHLRDADNKKLLFAPDLHKSLEIVDQFEMNVTNVIDEYIKTNGLNAPDEKLPQLRDGYNQPIVESLDMIKEDIRTIIWAVGYAFDYSFVKLPVFDKDGFPVQSNGATNYPGLYFVGLPWMPSEKSGFLVGVAESARQIAHSIAEPIVHL
ncbi:MAG TPA: NAD(P)/FAD-dependent oxidoreductase [Chitinophagaceae bacterium]|nr:NAD(P)/FAD-dependent oxidoreductase [Chitinophagaceae bacterium]